MAAFESWWAPVQRRQQLQDAQQGLRRAQAAQVGGYGSIAARFDPNAYGSIASRQMPGLFGPQGASNPEYQQQLKQQDFQRKLQQKAAMGLQVDAMKRRMAMQNGGIGLNYNMMSSVFDDGDDDDGL